MHMRRYSGEVSDAGRIAVASIITQMFEEVADPHLFNPVSKVFGRILEANELFMISRFSLGVMLDEVGYLAGTSKPELGVVPQALRLTGERLHEEFLRAKNAKSFRQSQDGSHVLLHLANMALPREPNGGVKPVDTKPLKLAFAKLANDATFDHVIRLSGVVMHTLQWREWNAELTARQPSLNQANRSYAIESAAELYDGVMKSAVKAVSRLALDRIY